MSSPSTDTAVNRLLAALPSSEFDLLKPHLKPVLLELRQIVFRPGDDVEVIYFPVQSIISLLTDLSDGTGMEVGLVGKEGFAGISAILGGKETKVGTVQAEGLALKISAEKLREAFHRGGEFQKAVLRYTHALMTQISQSVVCNVRHPLEGRLARWLLMYHDRLERDEFELTHEFMASMLGVRRASVSQVAVKLQGMGFIKYNHGHVQLIDREGLERFACECYPVVKEKLDEFLL